MKYLGNLLLAVMMLWLLYTVAPTINAQVWQTYFGYLLSLVCLFAYFLIWRKYRKEKRPAFVTRHYPPEGIDSAVAGYLVNTEPNPNDLVSLVLNWGTEGKIRVEETEKRGTFRMHRGVVLHKLEDLAADTPSYEQALFKSVFELSSVHIGDRRPWSQGTRALTGELMIQALRELRLASRVFYDEPSLNIRTGVMLFCELSGLVGLIIILLFLDFAQGITFFVTLLSIRSLSRSLGRKNARGTEVYAEVLGFLEFIEAADTDRIEMLLKEDPDYFEKTMSYAMAFGLFPEWAAKFEALNVPRPTWYTATNSFEALHVAPPNWYAPTNPDLTLLHFAHNFSSAMWTPESLYGGPHQGIFSRLEEIVRLGR